MRRSWTRRWSPTSAGSRRSPAERRERAYQETRPIGRAFGIPDALLPADLAAFDAYVAGMLAVDGPVHPGPLARELAEVILHPPLAPLIPAAAPLLSRIPPATYSWTLWPSLGLLPASVREAYGLSWGVRERAVSAWLVAGWRAWRPLDPCGMASDAEGPGRRRPGRSRPRR